MKGLLKIGLLVVLGYLAYKYYKKNYTTEGKIQAMADSSEMYGDKAAQLQKKWINDEVATAMIGVPTFAYSQFEAAIRRQKEQESENIDWVQRASLL